MQKNSPLMTRARFAQKVKRPVAALLRLNLHKCNARYGVVAMSRRYHHLSAEERAAIMIERQNGSSLCGPSPGAWGVRPPRSLASCDGPAPIPTTPRGPPPAIANAVHGVGVPCYWPGTARSTSTSTIAWSSNAGRRSRLRPSGAACLPPSAAAWVSPETIDASIYAYPRGGLEQALIEVPRQGKPSRGRPRTTTASRIYVPDELRF